MSSLRLRDDGRLNGFLSLLRHAPRTRLPQGESFEAANATVLFNRASSLLPQRGPHRKFAPDRPPPHATTSGAIPPTVGEGTHAGSVGGAFVERAAGVGTTIAKTSNIDAEHFQRQRQTLAEVEVPRMPSDSLRESATRRMG